MTTDRDDLAGVPAVTAFVMGIEYAEFRRHLRKGRKFTQLVHQANARRLRRAMRRKRREGVIQRLEDGMAAVTVEARAAMPAGERT